MTPSRELPNNPAHELAVERLERCRQQLALLMLEWTEHLERGSRLARLIQAALIAS